MTTRLDPNSIRKLRHRLQSRWQVCAIGFMGYRRPRRLRETTATSILKSSRHLGRVLSRYTRLIGKRQEQGSYREAALTPKIQYELTWLARYAVD